MRWVAIFIAFIIEDDTVFELQEPARLLHYSLFMGREEKSHSFFFIQPVHEIQESHTGLGVHIGSGFICQHQCRFRNYGPGNGHPLLLAPTQLPWEAILQPLQSHLRDPATGQSRKAFL